MKEKINSFSLCTLLLSLCASSFYGVFSSYLINKSKNASLISLIIGFLLSIVISKVFLTFIKQQSSLSFTHKIDNLYVKTSIIVNIIIAVCSLFVYILLTYRLTTFLSNEYLVNTPKYIILILILSLTYYTTSKGINTIVRVSVITFFISILIFLFDAFSLVSEIKMINYLPIIDTSFKNIIISSIIFAFYFSIPIIYLNVISFDNIKDKKNFSKYYYLTITLAFFIIFISVLTCIGVSSQSITKLFDYPVYSTLKRIKLFTALDSLENISISAWFLFIINASNIMLLYIFDSLKKTFKLNKKKSNIINILVMIISFSIPNFIFLKNNFNESFKYIYIPIIPLFIILLIVIVSIIKYKIKRTISSS